MCRLDGRPHLGQHFNEAVNGIRRLARRRTQLANRIKRAISVSVAVNNQQPVHKFSKTLELTPPPATTAVCFTITSQPSAPPPDRAGTSVPAPPAASEWRFA